MLQTGKDQYAIRAGGLTSHSNVYSHVRLVIGGNPLRFRETSVPRGRPRTVVECSPANRPYSPPSMSADQAIATLLRKFDDSSEAIERTRQAIIAGAREEELFHELRVAIKRLRSLSEVVAGVDPEFRGGKRLRRLRPLFRAAGRVRDRQLHNKRLHALMNPLMNPIEEISGSEPSPPPTPPDELAAVERFLRVAAKSDTTELFALRSRIAETLSPLSDNAIAPLIAHAWVAMLDQIAGWERGQDRTDLHSLRILAKRAHHALFLVHSMFPAARIDKAAELHLDRVQKLLGTWHDDEVALAHLESWTESSAAVVKARRELVEAKTKLATSAMNEYRRLRIRILRSRRGLISI